MHAGSWVLLDGSAPTWLMVQTGFQWSGSLRGLLIRPHSTEASLDFLIAWWQIPEQVTSKNQEEASGTILELLSDVTRHHFLRCHIPLQEGPSTLGGLWSVTV
jgi:hypothetical protein